MKKTGPDSLEGLFIAVVCCLISTLMLGTAGLSSMLFVACITRYNVDRNQASFPFILSNVVQAVSGPFAGYFARRFSVQAVVLVGSIFSFVGIGTCFLAEDITIVTVLWGIVFGASFGLSTLLLPAVINDYFYKQRSKALGVCFLGSPIGFFIFPPIFEVLLEKYGLSGTFLILSGINMHCIPLSLWLRQPKFKIEEENSPLNYGERRDSHSSTDSRKPEQIKQLESDICENNLEIKNGDSVCFRRFSTEILWNQNPFPETLSDDKKQYILVLNKKCHDTFRSNPEISRSYRKTNGNYYENTHKDLERAKSDICNPHEYELADENCRPKITDLKYPVTPKDSKPTNGSNCEKSLHCHKPQNYEELSTIFYGTSQRTSPPTVSEGDLSNLQRHNDTGYVNNPEENLHCYYNESYLDSNTTLTIPDVPTLIRYRKIDGFSNDLADKNIDEEKNVMKQPEIQTSDSSLLNMYLNPVFILICIINGIGSLHFSTLTTVIIDFSWDHKIDSYYDKFIMMCIALMGAVGMMGFGWVTDGGYMTRARFSSLTQLIGCICTAVLPLTVGFETLMVALALWCVCQASFMPQIPGIIAEHFKEDLQAVAVSACHVLSGPLYLIIPPLIGYFRDEKGSYDNIFYLLGALSFMNCIALFTIPYLARWKARL